MTVEGAELLVLLAKAVVAGVALYVTYSLGHMNGLDASRARLKGKRK